MPMQFGVCFVTVIGAILAGGSAVKVWIVYVKIVKFVYVYFVKFSDNFRTWTASKIYSHMSCLL